MTVYHLSLGANPLLWVFPLVVVIGVIVWGFVASRKETRHT